MKRMYLAALSGAIAISTLAVAIDAASAGPRYGVYRGGVNRVGWGRVGAGYGRFGYGRGYYRPGLGVAAGAGLAAAAYYGSGYYGGYANAGYGANANYNAYASTADDTSGGDTYMLHGNYISEADAVAYCANRFRSYDIDSRTFLATSGQREACPQ
jgi:hypothetical protein